MFGLFTAVLLALLYLAPPAQAQSMTLVGEVTVRFHTVVNIRAGDSTDHALIAKGQPGQIFPTTGQTAAGWYEIVLPDQQIGYLSGKLVTYRAYIQPIQHTPHQTATPPKPLWEPGQSQQTSDEQSHSYPVDVPVLPDSLEYIYHDGETAVYSGPGEGFYRAANGQALLAGGRIRVFGAEDGWAMIGYELPGNRNRIGYIPSGMLPASLNLQALRFAYQQATITSAAYLTDDPMSPSTWLFEIPADSKVILLAYGQFADQSAYIETEYMGLRTRGFINNARLQAD